VLEDELIITIMIFKGLKSVIKSFLTYKMTLLITQLFVLGPQYSDVWIWPCITNSIYESHNLC